MPDTDRGRPQFPSLTGCFRITEFLAWARISKTKMYAEINAGRLRMVKCGNRSLIRVEDALHWRDTLPSAQDAARPGNRRSKRRGAALAVVAIKR